MHSRDLVKPDGLLLTPYGNRPIPAGIAATLSLTQPRHAEFRRHGPRGECTHADLRRHPTHRPPSRCNRLARRFPLPAPTARSRTSDCLGIVAGIVAMEMLPETTAHALRQVHIILEEKLA